MTTKSRRRSEDVCFAEDHFKCWNATAADAEGYEFSSTRQYLKPGRAIAMPNLIQPAELSSFGRLATAVFKWNFIFKFSSARQ